MNSTFVVWLLSGCCFLLGCCQQFVFGVPALVAQDCGVAISDVGLLNTAFGVANGLGTPLALVLLTRLSKKRQLLAGLAVMFAGMVVMALTSVFGLLLGVRALMGVGHGVFVALSYTVAQSVAPRGKEGAYMANIALGFGLSQVVAIPLARVACGFVSWHALYALLASAGLIATALILKAVPDKPVDPADAAPSLKMMLEPFADPAVRMAVAATLLGQLGYSGMYTYITPFMEAGLVGHDAQFVSAVMLLIGLMSMAGTKGSGMVADRVGTRPTFLAGVALVCVCYCALFFSWGNDVATVAFACVWMVAAWSYVPLLNLLLTKRCPRHASLAISLTTSSLQFGGAVGAAVGGAVVAGPGVAFLPLLGVLGSPCALLILCKATRMMVEGPDRV